MRRLARNLALAAMLLPAALIQSQAPARAEVWYPWCAYYDWTTYNCGFVSLAQCRATAWGGGAICRPNPVPPPVRARRR